MDQSPIGIAYAWLSLRLVRPRVPTLSWWSLDASCSRLQLGCFSSFSGVGQSRPHARSVWPRSSGPGCECRSLVSVSTCPRFSGSPIGTARTARRGQRVTTRRPPTSQGGWSRGVSSSRAGVRVPVRRRPLAAGAARGGRDPKKLPREPGLRDVRVLGERPRRGAGRRRRPARSEPEGERVDEWLRGRGLQAVPARICGAPAARHVHVPSEGRERDHGRRERGRRVQRREPRPAGPLLWKAGRAAGADPGPRRELRGRRRAAERGAEARQGSGSS